MIDRNWTILQMVIGRLDALHGGVYCSCTAPCVARSVGSRIPQASASARNAGRASSPPVRHAAPSVRRRQVLRAMRSASHRGAATHRGRPRADTYTPGHLARRILSSRQAIEGERKQVTVLFADVRGSLEMLAVHPVGF